jgi:hypothetical protein
MAEPGEILNTNRHRGSFKSGNLQRAEWRSKTRHVLANHLSKSSNGPLDKIDNCEFYRNSARDVG